MPVNDEDDYIQTEKIPRWMAALAGKLIPALAVLVVSGLFVGWRNDAVTESRLVMLEAELRAFKKPGRRFTKEQGDDLADRVASCELWRWHHTEWGRQKAGGWEEHFKIIDQRLERLEAIKD